MNPADLGLLGVLALSGLIAFMRGFVREVLSLVAWVGAIVAALTFVPDVRPLVAGYVPSPDWADPLAYILLFVVSLIVFSLVAKVIGGAVRSSAIGGIDRSLGLVFGVARGAGLAVVAYIFAGMAVPIDHWPPQVLESRALPFIYSGAAWLSHQIPPEYQPSVPVHAPPARQTEANGLLSATPAGRAIDPPPRR